MEELSDRNAAEQQNQCLAVHGIPGIFSHVIFVFIEGDNITYIVPLFIWERTGIPLYPMRMAHLVAFLCLKCQMGLLDINLTDFF